MRTTLMVSHEVPIAMLELSRTFNQYDYALVHLFDNEEYFNFYRESLKMGRKVILDNSLFELGDAFESSVFYEAICKLIEGLEPGYDLEYIIPDCWCDTETTLNRFEDWMTNYANKLPQDCKSIGVMQGNCNPGLMYCFRTMSGRVNKIALSFGYDFWKGESAANKNHSLANNRISFIRENINELCLHEMHLLGCALPQEFRAYNSIRYDFISTIDTSNPVLHGMYNIKYEEHGLNDKTETKMNDLMHDPINEDYIEIIMDNIIKFRQLAYKSNVYALNYPYKDKFPLLNDEEGGAISFKYIESVDEIDSLADAVLLIVDGNNLTTKQQLLDKYTNDKTSWSPIFVKGDDLGSFMGTLLPKFVNLTNRYMV